MLLTPRSPAARALTAPALLAALLLSRAALAQAAPDDVVEVDASLRSLPRVTIVPVDARAVALAGELAKLVSTTALFDAVVVAPGTSTAGRVVRVAAEGDGHAVATTTGTDNVDHRRMVAATGPGRALQLARLADGVLLDLTGERSHLSGTLLYVDASTPGERRVRVMLGSGAPVRDASPGGLLARGPDVGPGGVVHYAAAAPGEPLRIFAEGKPDALAVKVPGFLQSVSFSPDGRRVAVVSGAGEGGSLFVGLLEGTMTQVATGPGIALAPSFGPGGELAWAAGPATGPLRVFVDGKPISGPGAWASAPSFCPAKGKSRLAYMLKNGASWTTVVTELDSGVMHAVGPGAHPACSPDGRTLAVTRPGSGATKGGVFLVGDDGVASRRVHTGEAAFLRWAPGPPVPPEG